MRGMRSTLLRKRAGQDYPGESVAADRNPQRVHFSPEPMGLGRVVQLVMNRVSIDSLKTARSRFRKEIKAANAQDEALFLRYLDMKNARPEQHS